MGTKRKIITNHMPSYDHIMLTYTTSTRPHHPAGRHPERKRQLPSVPYCAKHHPRQPPAVYIPKVMEHDRFLLLKSIYHEYMNHISDLGVLV